MKNEIDDLFYQYAIDNYYPLLAHEYDVLYRFIKKGNYYGALLQYKDVCEIILKFPTLIAINRLWVKDDYHYDDNDEKDNRNEEKNEQRII